jgi:hypothetical protein
MEFLAVHVSHERVGHVSPRWWLALAGGTKREWTGKRVYTRPLQRGGQIEPTTSGFGTNYQPHNRKGPPYNRADDRACARQRGDRIRMLFAAVHESVLGHEAAENSCPLNGR